MSEIESVIDFWWRKLGALAGSDWFGMKLEKKKTRQAKTLFVESSRHWNLVTLPVCHIRTFLIFETV